jgi:hypothetical protein
MQETADIVSMWMIVLAVCGTFILVAIFGGF